MVNGRARRRWRRRPLIAVVLPSLQHQLLLLFIVAISGVSSTIDVRVTIDGNAGIGDVIKSPGSTTLLQCDVEGAADELTAAYEWLLDGRRVSTPTANHVRQLRNIDANSTGLYRCIFIYNTSSTINNAIVSTGRRLKLTHRPTIVAAPKSLSVTPGSNCRLECAVDGEPTPTISWLKDGLPISGRPTQDNAK